MLIGCLAMLLVASVAGAAAARPNVVFMLTDDQGTLDANCYGSTDLFTPAMDRLAATGVRLTQAYSHAVCCPARAMLMTGRYPQRSGVNNWTQNRASETTKTVMARDEITLAEALRDAGYKTALFGKWHLGADLDHEPTEQGFDEFFGHRGGFIDNYMHFFMHQDGFHDLYDQKEEVFRRGEYFPDMVTARALAFIEQNRDGPFFLYLAFNLPHYPEQADAKFDARYAKMEMPRQSYAKVVSTVDDRMGRVLNKLEELGLRENTIVVFQSDNGHSEENASVKVDNHASGVPNGHYYGANKGGGNTGKWIGHKGQFLEGGIRVPAIISYPKALPQGVVRDQAVTLMDWMPTILTLCGVPRPRVEFDGHDIVPVIKENAPSPYKVMHWQWTNKWAVREGEWKLLGRDGDGRSLHNLNDTEPEKKNYLKEKPELAAHLLALHNEWAKDVEPKHVK